MLKTKIEDNAQKIWGFLDETQISSVFGIEKKLSMQSQDVLMALGWLARENIIYFLEDKRDSKIMVIVDMYEE